MKFLKTERQGRDRTHPWHSKLDLLGCLVELAANIFIFAEEP